MVDQELINKFSEDEEIAYIPKHIESYQISMIDEALGTLGDYGEVRLIVEKGRLRFIVTQKSFDALKWQPGYLSR
jgi:hypothetical protein